MNTELIPIEAEPLARRTDALAPDLAAIVERIITDPNADVSKLSALLDVNERILNRNAKAAFDEAFSRMWPELPEVDEKGAISVNGTVRSRYARYEDIQSAVRPVLKEFGFALRHRVEWPEGRDVIRIVGILSGHGHAEESTFEAPPDKNNARSSIQDQGATISYGKRYTTCDLLNIITRGVDNDGQGPKGRAPDGYEAWWKALEAVAGNGFAELEKMFQATKNPDFKAFTLNKNKDAWAELKRSASKKGGAK